MRTLVIIILILAIIAAIILWVVVNQNPSALPPQLLNTATSTPGLTVITQADDMKVIPLALHQQFIMQLGYAQWGFIWQPLNSITAVSNSVKNDTMQGIYQADERGTTTLKVIGRPVCQNAQPCPQYLINDTFTFVVK